MPDDAFEEATDTDLGRRIRDGDPAALADFLERHRDGLLAFLKSISSERLRSVVEPQDLFQDLSAAALTGLKTAPLEDYTALQWLRQIARRRVIDSHRYHFGAQRRDAGRQRSIHAAADGDGARGIEAMIVSSMTSPTAAVSRDIRTNRLREAIDSLPQQQRDVVRMRYIDGMPTKQIAEALGKSDVAVRVLLSRTMRTLEQQLVDVRPTPR